MSDIDDITGVDWLFIIALSFCMSAFLYLVFTV